MRCICDVMHGARMQNVPLYTFHLLHTAKVLCNLRNQWRTLETHMTVSLWLPIPHLEPSLLSSFGDSLKFIACSPSGIIHQISDLSVNTPARAENTALRCFFFCVCLIFKLAIRNALKWGVCCPNPSWIHSMFFFFFFFGCFFKKQHINFLWKKVPGSVGGWGARNF